ncbi:MAG: type II secretion system F family protein [Planctomycetota bacterium]
MPTFAYEALTDKGKTQKGTVEATSVAEAQAKIKADGYFPSAIREQKVKGKGKSEAEGGKKVAKKQSAGVTMPFGKVKSKQLTLFTRQLSTLQDAGLPLLRSLQILESQMKPGLMKNVLVGVCEEVEGGSSLSDAMAKYPRAFDTLYTKMVAAGEIGGVLDIILQRLSEFMEKAERLKRRIKGAMVYPVAVVIFAVLIVVFIMWFIIPQFEAIFTDFGVPLPALTVWLTNSSRWVAGQNEGQTLPGAVIVLLAMPVIWIGFKLIRKTGPGKAVSDTVFLWTPVFGTLIRKTVIARFTRTLGTLISAGVPILEAVTITKETSGNFVFEKALGKVHDSIREGESFAGPLRESKTCDPIVVNMIDVGEETGEMDVMLMKIADNYDEEVDVAVSALVSLLEPLMVIIIGGIVGTIVVAMFLPLVAMIESLQGGGV